MTHPILELQAADTLADQLRHRREHLPEQDEAAVEALEGELDEFIDLDFVDPRDAARKVLAALTARRHGLVRGYLTALPASLGVLALAVALLLAAAGIEAALIARR